MRTLSQLDEIISSNIVVVDVTAFNAIFGWHFKGSSNIQICRPESNSLLCVSQGEEDYWIPMEEEEDFMILLNELI